MIKIVGLRREGQHEESRSSRTWPRRRAEERGVTAMAKAEISLEELGLDGGDGDTGARRYVSKPMSRSFGEVAVSEIVVPVNSASRSNLRVGCGDQGRETTQSRVRAGLGDQRTQCAACAGEAREDERAIRVT